MFQQIKVGLLFVSLAGLFTVKLLSLPNIEILKFSQNKQNGVIFTMRSTIWKNKVTIYSQSASPKDNYSKFYLQYSHNTGITTSHKTFYLGSGYNAVAKKMKMCNTSEMVFVCIEGQATRAFAYSLQEKSVRKIWNIYSSRSDVQLSDVDGDGNDEIVETDVCWHIPEIVCNKRWYNSVKNHPAVKLIYKYRGEYFRLTSVIPDMDYENSTPPSDRFKTPMEFCGCSKVSTQLIIP